MLFIVIASCISAFELVNLTMATGTKSLKLLLGYKLVPELIFSLGLPILMLGTGTISGIVIASCTGLFITITLHVLSHTYGYAKYVKDPVTGKRKYTEFDGVPFSQFVRELGIGTFNKVKAFGIALTGRKANQ